jgi:hypothetical protein
LRKEDIGDFVRGSYAANPAATVLLGVIVAMWIFSVVCCLLLGPDSFGYMLYYKRYEYWSDFFNSLVDSYGSPYTVVQVIYPGLAVVMYDALAHLIIPIAEDSGLSSDESYAYAVRDTAIGTWTYLLLASALMVILAYLSYKILKERGFGKYSPVAAVLVVFSFPFIYSFDRGNIILLSMLLTLIFIRWYDSDNKYARWTAYIAIAAAVGIKIYPAFFLILLLRNRRVKDFVLCLVLSLALVFLPIYLTDGTPADLIRNILDYSSSNPRKDGIVNISDLVCSIWHGISPDTYKGDLCMTVATIATLSFELIGLIVAVWCRNMEKWEVLALIAIMTMLGPGVGTDYLYSYMLIPVLYFMTSESKDPRRTMFFAICFAATLCMVPGIDIIDFSDVHVNWDTVNTTMKTMFVFAMAADLLYNGYRRMRGKAKEPVSKPAEN